MFTGMLSASWSWDHLYFKGLRVAVGGWWLVTVGGWWRLAAVGGWRLVGVGGWWSAVGGGFGLHQLTAAEVVADGPGTAELLQQTDKGTVDKS